MNISHWFLSKIKRFFCVSAIVENILDTNKLFLQLIYKALFRCQGKQQIDN